MYVHAYVVHVHAWEHAARLGKVGSKHARVRACARACTRWMCPRLSSASSAPGSGRHRKMRSSTLLLAHKSPSQRTQST